MTFQAPIYGQVGERPAGRDDFLHSPTSTTFDWDRYLREIRAGRTPDLVPTEQDWERANTGIWDESLIFSASQIQALQAQLQTPPLPPGARAIDGIVTDERGNPLSGVQAPLSAEDRQRVTSQINTLGAIAQRAQKQRAAGNPNASSELIPLLSNGQPTGYALNPNNPDGAPINLSAVSPDQQSQVQEQATRLADRALDRQSAADRSTEATNRTNITAGAQQAVANTNAASAKYVIDARAAIAQVAANVAREEANIKLRQAEMALEGKDIETTQRYSKEISDMQEKALHENASLLDRAFQGLTTLDIAQVTQSVEWDKIGESARKVTQEAINKRVEAIQAEDIADYQGRVSQRNVQDKGVADLVGKMWDSYVGSLKDMSTVPEGWFQAVQKAGRTQAYARQLPGFLADIRPSQPDLGKFDEFAQKARGLFGPLEQSNYRPLPEREAEYQRLPPPDLSATSAANYDLANLAAQGRAAPMPDMPQNPLNAGGTTNTGYLPRDRNAFAGSAAMLSPDAFQAPVAAGMEEPPPDEGPSVGSSMLQGLMNEPDYVPPPIDMTMPEEGGYTAPFAGGDPQADFELYRPLIENAPDQALVPSLLNFMAGLNARDDVADNPEEVLKKEYDYAFSPFGSTYTLDPNDFGDLYSDNSSYGYDDSGYDSGYGGIF